MKRIQFLVAILCLWNLSAVASETKPPNPVSEFAALAKITYLICALSIKNDMLAVETGETSSLYPKYTDCRNENKALLKTKYQAAKIIVPAKSEADTLLKDFYAFWITSLDGLVPQSGERKYAYENRTSHDEAELSRLAKRLEIELGLE